MTSSSPQSLPEIASSGGGARLLVSVRNAAEAAAALAGGASVIDIKEPANGPLGAARGAAIRSVLDLVAGRAPVTAALGELKDLRATDLPPLGLAAAKVGLAKIAEVDWRARFDEVQERLAGSLPLVPAAYADARIAGSPPPAEVLRFATDRGLGWMVLDTWDKSRGDLLDSLPARQIASLVEVAREGGVKLVLAGSLRGGALVGAVRLNPALVGVRGAACRGGRAGNVETDLVENLVRQLDGCRFER